MHIASAYLILLRGDQTFLMKRQNTGYEDGNYGLIAGHVQSGETIVAAMIREAREEAAIEISDSSISFALLLDRYAPTSDPAERLDVFFLCDWDGAQEPVNMEPEECAEIGWFPVDDLPVNCIEFIRYAIEQVRSGKRYAKFGWPC
ncbi:MAG TPA: NUDIX domain-containing protein [Candidatus Melainabacteria bacterium]|nr:NUDIX domain-containing protein [Candidatus Melainabacteria bacterium]